MRRNITCGALLFLGLAHVPHVAAQTYSAILECSTRQASAPSLIRISGTDAKPSWQYWSREEMRWGDNLCNRSEGSGHTLVNTCRLSPASYARSFDVTSPPAKPDVLLLGWVARIDRVSGEYTEILRTYLQTEGYAEQEQRHGSCRPGVEPDVPKARF
jgi:hypothetical protein